MSYNKGRLDRGDMADKYVALVVFDDKFQAMLFAKKAQAPWASSFTVHKAVASHYDIDYNQHKILLNPPEEEDDGQV